METIIGLGSVGKNIAEQFLQYSKYKDNIIVIDEETSAPKNPEEYFFFGISKQTNGDKYAHEKYERPYPELKVLDSMCEDDVLFITSGASDISGATLSILSHIRDKNITVLYVRPDRDFLSDIKMKQEQVTFGILQQYARSGGFERIILVDNNSIEDIIGNVPIKDYYSYLNEVVVHAIYTMNYCNNTEAEFENIVPKKEVSRISTLGILRNGEEKLFFPLQRKRDGVEFPAEKIYYYLLSDEKMNEGGKALREIKDYLKSTRDKLTKASYGIFSGGSENYTLIDVSTSLVQETKH